MDFILIERGGDKPHERKISIGTTYLESTKSESSFFSASAMWMA